MGIQEGKKIVNGKRWKKTGIILSSVSAVALIVVSMFLLFRSGKSGGFTVHIVNPAEANHVTMSDDPKGGVATILSASPIDGMYPTTASKVEAYLQGFADFDAIRGSHNMMDDNPSREGMASALVYTLFLTNDGEEEQELDYEVQLDSYVRATNGATGALDYLRVMVQTSIDTIDGNQSTKYFAKASNSNLGTDISETDNSEPISTWEKGPDNNFKTARISNYVGLSESRYCENFIDDKNNNVIVRSSVIVPAKKTMRFTFVEYLEGEDQDCKGQGPNETTLLMSLYFGRK